MWECQSRSAGEQCYVLLHLEKKKKKDDMNQRLKATGFRVCHSPDTQSWIGLKELALAGRK